MVEGKTEDVFKSHLLSFLKKRIPENNMPRVSFNRFDGRIPTGEKLRRRVNLYLADRNPADHVIALTDVYTGTREFADAADAKNKMRTWVGVNPRFHPHVALHDFEAWLLPYWNEIQRLSGSNRASPGAQPEHINHQNPPSHRIQEAFRTGKGGSYVKARDALSILKGKDLLVSANACPELKSFLNTLLELAGGDLIP